MPDPLFVTDSWHQTRASQSWRSYHQPRGQRLRRRRESSAQLCAAVHASDAAAGVVFHEASGLAVARSSRVRRRGGAAGHPSAYGKFPRRPRTAGFGR